MIRIVKVMEARATGPATLWLRFSDGSTGVRDLSDMLAKGGVMVEPLRDPDQFARVFVEMGVPTWPTGFDLDPIARHQDMAREGALTWRETISLTA